MFAYRIVPGENIRGLARVPIASRQLHAQEVRVRVRAVALNYRDLMVARGNYPLGSNQPVVPCSDGAGEVMAVGPAVERFRVGDRVIATFFTDWIDGEIAPEKTKSALGGSIDGVLAEEIVAHEDALVGFPAELSFAQAATLPCAGLTAWNMLFVANTLRPGASVVLLGTGGVSIWALQLAKAAGLRTIITSSSAAKLERARTLGADELVNYKANSEWQEEVLRFTDGRGADLVAELGGHDTFTRSIAATRMGGTIALIGGVSGFTSEIDILNVLGGKKLVGIYVGSRRMLEDLVRFVAASKIAPVIDRVFHFEDAQEAYVHLDAQRHLGKVVIEIPS
jgi:NADPH:quinone reductase-like Zn-dependent oxidoreductase